MAEVEQVDVPFVCQDEDSSSDESMGSAKDASGEREQSCRDDDSRSELYSSVQGKQSEDSTRDTLADESQGRSCIPVCRVSSQRTRREIFRMISHL